jgi:hypothetical protein
MPAPSLGWDTADARKPWSAELLKAVAAHRPDLDGGNPEGFVPGYAQLSAEAQAKYWGEFFVAVAKLESDWNPHAFYEEDESINDSVGLFQISYADQQPYGLEPLDPKAKSLEDPLVNIRCAVKMMAHWLRKDGVVAGGSAGKWRGGARYWAVLRKAASRAKIQAYVKKQMGL